MAKLHDVAAALSRHRGRDNGITACQLAGELGMAERTLRHFISDLRDEGIAVCGHPTTGYYIADTADELERTCAFLRSRAMHSLVLESRLRKIPLPDLIGQLRLNT
jgi:biotin operon repressor